MSRFAHQVFVAALSAILVGITPPSAQAVEKDLTKPSAAQSPGWTRLLDLDLSRNEVGLGARASASRLARAALERNAGRLGLSRRSGLRLASEFRPPQSAGGRALRMLRFQQTASGLRVVWSQIDVTIAAGEVSSISATVVPVKGRAVTGERKVSRGEALRIARRAVPRAEAALRPLPAAYAGTPSAKRGAKWREPKRVWVVELQPPAAPGDDAPTGLCVVVDARSGKVIARWPGIADRPDRGPDARGARARAAGERSAFGIAQTGPRTQLLVGDGRNGGNAPIYARYNVSGDPRAVEWPHLPVPLVSGVSRNTLLDAASTNARNIARTICDLRGYCGVDGGFRDRTSTYSGTVTPWQVAAATQQTSRAFFSIGLIWLDDNDILGVNSANDILAHEMGHLMDFNYAGDRASGSITQQTDEVEEALADMFAYEYDRFDATLGEEVVRARINWENPGAIRLGGQPYPSHMRDYDDTPPNELDGQPSEHLNSTILSHAYWRFVQAVGHHKAGRVLHNVPASLGPRPTFQQVTDAFWFRAHEIYGNTVGGAATSAFAAVGLTPSVFDPCFGLPRPSPKCP